MPGTFRPAPACWSGQQASILRPLVPQTSALPGCAMPRLNWCPTARWPGPGGPWPTGLFPLLQGGDALLLVGVRGFEPPTLWSRTRCATRLRYTPMSHRPDRSVRLRPDGCVTTRRTSRDPGVFLRGGCPDDRLKAYGSTEMSFQQCQRAWHPKAPRLCDLVMERITAEPYVVASETRLGSKGMQPEGIFRSGPARRLHVMGRGA